MKLIVTLALFCALTFLTVEGVKHKKNNSGSHERESSESSESSEKTSTTTKASTKTTTATATTTQLTTMTTTTTAVPLCSYGTKLYNNDNSIDGIAAGPAVDGTNVYVGFTQVNGITIPGMLMLNNSVLPGLTYIYNNNVTLNQTSNVFYLTNTPDCNCQFVDKNASLPVGSYKVTLNNGTNKFYIGKNDHAGDKFNINVTVIGAIINGSLHYFNSYDKFDTITADYKVLVCGLPLNFITTTTLSPITTMSSANNTNTVSTTTDYAKQIDDSVNGFIVLMNDATQTITNLNTIKDDSISFINKSLADSNTTKNDALIYQELFNIFNSPIIARRRKRQTIDDCQNATQIVETEKNVLANLQTYHNYYQNIIFQVYETLINSNNFTVTAEAQNKSNNFIGQFRNLTTQINQCKQRLSELTAIRDDVCSKTTTTIPTTTTTPVSCAYSWNLYASNNLPPSDGLYVGKNPYGHDIYVGAGTGGGDLAPGSLEPLYLNGVTVQSSYVVYNVTTNVTYLAIPSSCKCNWLPNGDLYNTPALVRLRNFYWVGRYNFTDGSHVVGKVYDQGSGYGIIMTHVENNQEILGTVFDVLQCTA
ncbi:hypothetical protein PVAND_017027 [Polypedilum vanderplanki]|uniref:Uncharacterized protein n=1 Tax=Polypedilum vanderplanki TaxID=319348 RepID=A0A9J6BHX3_POLVA|nr:hypothetical protein PVAND_017027 [Polypedilum vanderplanki]